MRRSKRKMPWSDRHWRKVLRSKKSLRVLFQLAEEALREHREGRTIPLDSDDVAQW